MSARGGRRLGERGQMTVELAVVTPVVIVVALVVLNLMWFVEACAAFDQAALDAVVSHGVAPAGEQSQLAAVDEVRDALSRALGREETCEVEVSAEAAGEGSPDATFAISPLLTRYTCTLVYRPWPRLLRMPGVTFEAPLSLRHERELVVDRYRPGVVVQVPLARLCREGRPGEALEVTVLSTWRERLRGLLGTGPDAGAVMLTLCSSVHTFGMRYDTDLAFVGERGEVLLVRRRVPPGMVCSEPRARCVIERPARDGGWVEQGERLWVASVSADGLGAL